MKIWLVTATVLYLESCAESLDEDLDGGSHSPYLEYCAESLDEDLDGGGHSPYLESCAESLDEDLDGGMAATVLI